MLSRRSTLDLNGLIKSSDANSGVVCFLSYNSAF